MRPHLGQIERVESIGLGILERHDLHLQRPRRVVTALDRLKQVAGVVIGVHRNQRVGLGLGQVLDALVGDEVVAHPELLPGGVDPHEGMSAVEVHVPPAAWDAAIAHQPGDLVRRLRRERPEVPLHVVVTKVVVSAALLGPNETRKLQRVAQEEHRGVIADDVVIALGGVELQREAPRVAPGVWAAALTGNGGEPDHRFGCGSWLKHCRLGERADIIGHLEAAERTRALGVRLALGHAFAIELRQLLDEVVVMQQNRSVRPDAQRMLVALYRDTGVRRRRNGLDVSHCRSSHCWTGGSLLVEIHLQGSRRLRLFRRAPGRRGTPTASRPRRATASG